MTALFQSAMVFLNSAQGNSGLILVAILILVAGIIAMETKVSVAILEILIGVFAANYLAIGSTEWIEFPALFGLVGIMFFAGFEMDQELFKQYWKKSLTIGLSSYFIPFIMVFLLAYYYLGQDLQPALLLSIGLSTTSLALVYAIMVEKKMLDKTFGQIILSAAMVVDVLSMLTLMIIFEGVSLRSFVTLGIFIVALFFFPRIGKMIFSRYKGNSVEFQSRFIFVLLLSLMIVANVIDMHLAIIAFITGFLLSEIIKSNHQLETNLKSVIFGFMAPIFFFKAGLSINLDLLTKDTLKLALVLGSVAFIGKYLATYIPFKKYFSAPESKFAALAFNYRLSFGIIVATFGLDHGLFSQDIYIGVLTVVVLSSIASTIGMKVKKMPDLKVADYSMRFAKGTMSALRDGGDYMATKMRFKKRK
jgi:Kef-type K+ transport system membrane component KefB